MKKKKTQTIAKNNHKPYKEYDLKADRYKYYKGKYIITFYDEDDEFLLFMFDTVKDILKYQKKEINKKNIGYLSLMLYLSLRNPDTTTKMLDGVTPMKVHIIDILDEN